MEKLKISERFRKLIPALNQLERDGLEAAIERDGCLSPLVTWRGYLLDGHNRFEICERLGKPYKTVEVECEDEDWAALWIRKHQLSRRNLTDDQRAMIADEAAEEESKLVRQKQAKAARARVKARNPVRNSDVATDVYATSEPKAETPGRKPRTAEKAAKVAGVSERKMRKARKVRKASKKLAEKVESGEITLKQAEREIKELEREAQRDENREKVSRATSVQEISGVFSTVVLDPPWDWGDEGDNDQLGRARPDYATMSIERIGELPVDRLADKSAHLYLWITNRSMPKGFALMEKWGFRFITILTWPKPSFGMGNYFRGQTEHVLFGVRGSQGLKRKDASTLLPAWSRGPGGHSSKPVGFHEFVESCSPGPYLEMFSRSSRKDWTAWGEGS